MAQLVKNVLAMRETWVSSLGWEDHLEKGTATHSSILDFGNDLFSKKKKDFSHQPFLSSGSIFL